MNTGSSTPTFTLVAVSAATESSAAQRGPDLAWLPVKPGRNYLLRAEYRKLSLIQIFSLSGEEMRMYLASLRWGQHGEDKQVCPTCGSIATHYWCESVGRWKCREKTCGKQFSVFSGTRVHGMRMSVNNFLSLLFHFVEAKDSVSARELSGLHDLNHATVHVLTLKIREAIRVTMSAEPLLTGYVHADAAYFMKYVRPANVGTGASFAAKRDQKNAGLNEGGRTSATVSPKMHALVVFVQAGRQGERRYKVACVKTETQLNMLELGQRFCTKTALLVTDQHSAYNVFSGAFDAHYQVNHSQEFMSKDGIHTNLAESFFARLRAAVSGAWHKMTLQHMEEYGWEFAWRQTMVGSSNLTQLEDLVTRVLNSGRAKRFGDYWGKRPGVKEKAPTESSGRAVELGKDGVKKKRGRPLQGSVRPKEPEQPKRKYKARVATAPKPS